jgi:uncharacterized membrane protein YfcA
MWIGLLFASLGAGVLIGTVGVGGILLIPALAFFAQMPIQEAMATALFTFVLTGLMGVYQYQRRGSIDWRMALPVCLGAVISGFLGARLNAYVNARVLSFLLYTVILFSGLYTLYASRYLSARNATKQPTGTVGLVIIGLVVGFISGLTGVGGPVVSVPLMVILGFAPLATIATSQVLQIPAAVSGTIGNLMYGHINFTIAAWAALLEVLGVYAGAHLAHIANVKQLRLLVAVVCILVGGSLILRTYYLSA